MVNIFLGLFLFILLLLGNAFFVAAEFSIMSVRRSQVEPLSEEGSRSAKVVLFALENVSLMLACAQFGITVCSLLILNVTEPVIHKILYEPFIAAQVSESIANPLSFVIALVIVSFLHVTLGEVVPKNMAFSAALPVALLLGPVLVVIARLLTPIIFVLNWCANTVLRLFRVDVKDEIDSSFTLEQVQNIVATSTKEGLVDDDSGLLSSALDFSGHRVSEMMIPIKDVCLVEEGVTPNVLEEMVAATGFSRFLVMGKRGYLCGYLHLKDVLYADANSRDEFVPFWRVRDLFDVHLEEEIEGVLAVMQRSGLHIARVLNDGGVEVGVLFLEDVLEILIGEVHDFMNIGI